MVLTLPVRGTSIDTIVVKESHDSLIVGGILLKVLKQLFFQEHLQ